MSALRDRLVTSRNDSQLFPYPCVILCGGASRRMGVDKARLPFGESKTLMEYQYKKLKPLFHETYLACKKQEKVPFKADILLDQTEVFAPTVALKSAFESLETEYLFCLPVDTPFVDRETIKILVESIGHYDAVVASSPSGVHNLIGLFHKSIVPIIDTMHQNACYKVGYLLKQIRTREVFFSSDDPFVNLNRPRDYSDALQIYGNFVEKTVGKGLL